MTWTPAEGGGGGLEKWGSVSGPLFCVRTDVGAKGTGTQNLTRKSFFQFSQNDQRDVGIILSHRCCVDLPPPRHGRSGTPALNPPLPSRRPRRVGGGGGWENGPPCQPPPQSNFLPAKSFHQHHHPPHPLPLCRPQVTQCLSFPWRQKRREGVPGCPPATPRGVDRPTDDGSWSLPLSSQLRVKSGRNSDMGSHWAP